jgi:hypothetical protein
MLGDIIKGSEFTYQIFLCKPVAPYSIMACLSDCSYGITLKRQLMNIDELEFTLPYYWNDIKSTKNENFDLVKSGTVILLQSYIDDTLKEQQYFHIYQTERSGGDKETKKVSCYSLEYKMNKVRIRKFSTNTTGDFVATRMIYNNQTFDPTDKTKGGMVDYILQTKLQNTWSVSYMSSSLSGIYRTFDISEKTVMETFHEIEQNFNCIFFFDTVNRTIQIRDYDDLPNETGLILHDSNYIKQLQEKIKIDEIVTRLYVQGDKDATMSGANPTGQDYVDNFTFFRTTQYMSQSLLDALTAYDAKLITYASTFATYQTQLLAKQAESLDLYQNPTTGLYKLQTNLLNIQNNEDTIIRTKAPITNGHDYNYWYSQEAIAKTAIATQQGLINSKKAEIDAVTANIYGVASQLSYTNLANFSTAQLQELFMFVNEDNAKCNTEDAKDLYMFGKDVLAIKSQPPIEFDVSIVDVLNCADENYTWDKLVLGAKIDLLFEDFDIQSKPRITAYTHNFDTNQLSLTVSNKTYYNDDLNYITAIFTKSKQTATTVDTERDTYKDYQNDKDAINDYINSPIDVSAQPIELDQATVILERRGMFARSIDGAGGAMRVMDNKIVMSKDNFSTYSTAITGDGIFCDHLWTLTNTGGSVEINADTILCSDMRLNMTTWNNKNRIIVDPTSGIKIQSTIGATPIDVFYVDNNGNLQISGNISMTGGLIGSTPMSTLLTNAINGASAWNKFSGTGNNLPSGNVDFNFANSTTKGGNALNTDAVGTKSATQVQNTVLNFDNRNDRLSATPTLPAILLDGTCIDHTVNTDSTSNVSFEWQFTNQNGNANDIDGFIVYVYQSTASSVYAFGTNTANEQIFYVTPEKRAFILYGVPVDQYYTFGVQAYRIVDPDVNAIGVLRSAINKSTYAGENPYRPSASVSFNGDVLGTVAGVSASTVKDQAGNSVQLDSANLYDNILISRTGTIKGLSCTNNGVTSRTILNSGGLQVQKSSNGGSSWSNVLSVDGSGNLSLVGSITITSATGISNFSDAGGLATKNNLDDVPNGTTYNKTTVNQVTGAGRAYSALDSSNDVISRVKPSTSMGNPSVAGLYMGSDYIGFHNGNSSSTGWNAYIKNDGKFKFNGDSNNFIEWTGSALNVRGTLNASDITSGTITGITMQTATSGNSRIVLSGAGLFTYGSDNKKNGTCLVPSVSDLVMYNSDIEFFRIENTDGLVGVVKLKGYSDDILGYNNTQGKTYALGTWSFSSCTVEGFQVKFA